MVICVRQVHQDSRDGQQLMGEECGGDTCSETGLSWPVKGLGTEMEVRGKEVKS